MSHHNRVGNPRQRCPGQNALEVANRGGRDQGREEDTAKAESTKETSSNSTRAEAASLICQWQPSAVVGGGQDEPEAQYAKGKAGKAKRDAATDARGGHSSSTLRRRASAQGAAASLVASLESSSPATTKPAVLKSSSLKKQAAVASSGASSKVAAVKELVRAEMAAGLEARLAGRAKTKGKKRKSDGEASTQKRGKS